MTRQMVTNFMTQHLWKVVLVAFTIGGAWTSQASTLANKADKSTVDSVFVELREQRKENQRNFTTVKSLLCRQTPNDSWCKT